VTRITESTSDESLRAKILEIFFADSRTNWVNLRVGVLNGIAHLAGTVDSVEMRFAAEEFARQMPGVRGVVNRIEAPGAPSPAREINLDLKDENERRKNTF
jgi:osmotically-inducible protein OsmY